MAILYSHLCRKNAIRRRKRNATVQWRNHAQGKHIYALLYDQFINNICCKTLHPSALTDLLNVMAGMSESVQKRDHRRGAAILAQHGIDQNLSQKKHTNAIQPKEMLEMSENVPKNILGSEASGNLRVMHLNRRLKILSVVVHVNVQQQ